MGSFEHTLLLLERTVYLLPLLCNTKCNTVYYDTLGGHQCSVSCLSNLFTRPFLFPVVSNIIILKSRFISHTHTHPHQHPTSNTQLHVFLPHFHILLITSSSNSSRSLQIAFSVDELRIDRYTTSHTHKKTYIYLYIYISIHLHFNSLITFNWKKKISYKGTDVLASLYR